MSYAITAHGKTLTIPSARARISELEALNAEIGESDGRVTEINAIREALDEAGKEAAIQHTLAVEARNRAAVAGHVASARRELETLERNTPGDGRIEYWDNVGTDEETHRIARYTTRDGFLRGYIKFNTSSRYGVIHVDGN